MCVLLIQILMSSLPLKCSVLSFLTGSILDCGRRSWTGCDLINLKITYNILFSTFLLKCDVSLQIFFNIFFFLLFFLLHDTFFSKCCAIFFQNNSLFSLNIKVFFPKTLKTMFLKYSLFSVNITTFLQNITYFFSKYYNFFLWLWQLFLITLQLYFENIMTLQCSENSITFSRNIKGFFQNTFSQKI